MSVGTWTILTDRLTCPPPLTDLLIAHDLGDGEGLIVSHGLWDAASGQWLHATHNWFDANESPEIDGAIIAWMLLPKPPVIANTEGAEVTP